MFLPQYIHALGMSSDCGLLVAQLHAEHFHILPLISPITALWGTCHGPDLTKEPFLRAQDLEAVSRKCMLASARSFPSWPLWCGTRVFHGDGALGTAEHWALWEWSWSLFFRHPEAVSPWCPLAVCSLIITSFGQCISVNFFMVYFDGHGNTGRNCNFPFSPFPFSPQG